MTDAVHAPTPRVAMVLAAGLATRMRPLTDVTAKPLLEVHGRSLLDRALDRLADAGVDLAVINAHWQAEQVAARLARRERPRCIVLHEEKLLDTGGAVVAALPYLTEPSFFVVNGDSLWLDGPAPALTRLVAAFDPEEMDAILLLHRSAWTQQASANRGDFALDPLGRVRRPNEREVVPFLFTGIQLVARRLFEEAPPGAFGMMRLWDRLIEAGRLFALVHDGLWLHVSTPDDLAHAEEVVRQAAYGLVR